MTIPARRIGLLVMAAMLAILAGCEAMTPAECATADWGRRGFEDGSKGRVDRSADYYESCSKAGQRVEVAIYRAGRDQGLLNYCRPDNAINEGLAGRTYAGVCPPQMDSNFRVFHQAAYAEQDARKTVARLQSEQRAMDAELRDSKTPDERRAQLRELLSRSDRRIADARDAQQAAQRRLDRLRNDLRQMPR
ncbi:MAG: DUF2799 domain-containing protein [Polaromonas sp.]|uniref:DUF2799 domain-containing protein n=1 Tax=Polaromonas sp. TaxID=1869339 RepID=UPI0025DC34F1|nr:DUF2799 domain-containing protein [Polaromonas sp.]MBI2728105.1 DUF2799 domain-containing protein [Polaromonas sp.]